MEWPTPEYASKQPDVAVPRFYIKQKQDQKKTLQEGRPIFCDQEYVEIRIPGDNKNIIDRKVLEKDIKRWPDIYKQFKDGVEAVVEGTPIDQWNSLSASRAMELKAMRIMTVEQLAGLPDTIIQKIGMDGHTLSTKAKAFINTARESGFAEKLAVENQRLKNDVEFLKESMAPLVDKLEELSKQIEELQKGNENDSTK